MLNLSIILGNPIGKKLIALLHPPGVVFLFAGLFLLRALSLN